MSDEAAAHLLAQFARRVIREGCFEGTSVDGGALQEWAEELGLIYPRQATEADIADNGEFEVGDKMYFLQPWLLDMARVPSMRDKFEVGNRVTHLLMGSGVVTENDQSLMVTFDAKTKDGERNLTGCYDDDWFRMHPKALFPEGAD